MEQWQRRGEEGGQKGGDISTHLALRLEEQLEGGRRWEKRKEGSKRWEKGRKRRREVGDGRREVGPSATSVKSQFIGLVSH